jgi:hypothetical protein
MAWIRAAQNRDQWRDLVNGEYKRTWKEVIQPVLRGSPASPGNAEENHDKSHGTR